ncbi:DUF4272 domain-containing protein [Lysinibacillus cavernae]|uniref:DUF4272 domain-containing protein n=1 Tax=Lysinibacillus cavernae TaxID=2666135 RepID=UPI0012D8ABDA|nr:DUF4272 domain-containing protein [Lysinibacillus cavernae]
MNHFTIFASKNDTDDIQDKLSDVFAKGFAIEKRDNEYIVKSKGFFKKYRCSINVLSEDTDPDYFAKNIPGMMGYYDAIPFEDERLKELVMIQISVFNTVIAIEMDKEMTDDHMQLFTNLLASVGGIGFLPGGTLLDQNGVVIVYPNGESGPSDFRPHACTRKIKAQEITSAQGEARKNKTIAFLTNKEIPYAASLPQLPPLESYYFKSQEEIAKRAVALLIIIQFACDVAQNGNIEESRDFFTNMLRKYEVQEWVTDHEKLFFEARNPSTQEAVNISWQYEAYWTLIWALGLVEELNFPDDVCDCEYAIQVVSGCETFEQFYDQTTMRDKEEMLDEADKIYRLHWACVDSRINGQVAPLALNESVVMERRRGLFWIIGYQQEEWDTISMDT